MIPQTPRFLTAILAPIFLLLLFLCLAGCSGSLEPSALRLTEVGPFSATLEWETAGPADFRIVYGEGTLFDREVAESEPTTAHRLTLSGLKPSTRYTYRLEPGGEVHAFRSAPGKDGAFDLIVLGPGSPACARGAPGLRVYPDLVILAGECAGRLAGRPESILTVELPAEGSRILRFGRNRLVLAPDNESAAAAEPAQEGAGLRTIVVTTALPEAIPEALEEAVILSPRGARFDGERVTWDSAQTAWLEVDAFEIAWVQETKDYRVRRVIVEAPPETKKSCLYCDRLLESGRYKESLAWYRDFIATNQDRHAVEDAAFSVARILDEKLFRYGEAVEAYRRFLEDYPESRRTTLARYRLDYILARSDLDYRPLERFEKAKAELVRDDPLPAAAEVERMVADFPAAAVAEDALFWLGNLLETVKPDQARSWYRALLERFPQGENAAMAAIALGDIEYRQKSYRLAEEAYEAASKRVPKKYHIAISDKLRKSRRNLKREWARYLSWTLLAGWLAASVVAGARPNRDDLRAPSILLAAYSVIGGLLLAVAFETVRPLLPVLSVLAVAMPAVTLWNRALSRSSTRRAGWIAVLHALSCSLAVLYLAMYGCHHLYIFGL